MSTAVRPSDTTVGDLLRKWRQHRRLSQLDLSIQADISTRHLSFVETGRSAPSRDMVLHLAEQLDLPLRERNRLLIAAGYAPVYAERSLGTTPMAAVRDAVRQVLTGHEPYPAVAVDGRWNLVDTNEALSPLLHGVAPALLEPPVNALRASLHPDGMAPRIANLGEWRGHLLGRLRRQVEHTADPELSALYDELVELPCDDEVPPVEHPGPGDVVVPLRLRHPAGELTFFSTVTTFGTPLDITVAELAIEAFFPADPATAAILHAARSE